MFDVGVVLGSQCDEIWNEYVDMHPGAVRMRKLVEHYPCPGCGKLHGARKNMQLFLSSLIGQNQDDCLEFLAEIQEDMTDLQFVEAADKFYLAKNPLASVGIKL